MFWKKDKSLVTKLVVLHTISTIGILISIGLFLYPTFVNVMLHVDHNITSYLMTMCYRRISVAIFLASIGAIVLGYYIAKRSLSSLNAFAKKMEEISADSLHERIHPNEWPSELKILGEKFNHMLDRLEKSFTQLSHFSANIAHELRHPIHHLMVSAELALSNEKSINDYQQMLESHLEEYAHLSRLIENLLFLARADHGQLILKREKFDIGQVIDQQCEFFQAMAEEKKIHIHRNGDALLFADRNLLMRVINNLLANALKYARPGGKIDMKIISVGNKQIELAISDTGCGIAKEDLTNIFDRFYRTDSSRSSQSGGLGLGLAIVKSIVQLHLGTIRAESEIDVGTTVIVSLPCAANA